MAPLLTRVLGSEVNFGWDVGSAILGGWSELSREEQSLQVEMGDRGPAQLLPLARSIGGGWRGQRLGRLRDCRAAVQGMSSPPFWPRRRGWNVFRGQCGAHRVPCRIIWTEYQMKQDFLVFKK